MEKKGKEKRKKQLLKEGIHVIDSEEGRAYCPVTGKAAERLPRDLIGPCQMCGRDGLTGRLI